MEKNAFEVITSAHLRYPGEELLHSFILEARHPKQVADFVLERAREGSAGLDALLSDWKSILDLLISADPVLPHLKDQDAAYIRSRDGSKCRLSGLGPCASDPLVIAPMSPWSPIGRVSKRSIEVLKVFLGGDVDKLVAACSGLQSATVTDYFWVVRKSMFTAQSKGFVGIRFCFPTGHGPQQRYFLRANMIGETSDTVFKQVTRHGQDVYPSEDVAPDLRAADAASRFATSVRWLLVGRQVEEKSKNTPVTPVHKARCASAASHWTVRAGSSALTNVVLFLVFAIWRLVPGILRIFVYLRLASLGHRLYGRTSSYHVLRLPFGLYLKDADHPNHQGLANEFGALKLVRAATSKVTVPRPLDLVSDAKSTYLLTSAVPGERLGAAIDTMSHEEAHALVGDLQTCLTELRCISRRTGSWRKGNATITTGSPVPGPGSITSAIGGPIYDYRVNAGMAAEDIEPQGLVGPFKDEEDFNRTLQTGALPGLVHRSGHDIVFTHGDLNLRNVIVHEGRLSGFVDWENSGWFPDYWEYTKALFVTKHYRRWLRIVDEVFGMLGDFEEDKKIERQYWEYCF